MANRKSNSPSLSLCLSVRWSHLLASIAGVALMLSLVSQTQAETYQSGYQIGPEDVLEINVWKEEGLQKEVLVRPDGKISFPLIGDVDVLGFTPDYVRQMVSKNLERYIPNPAVTVLVKKVAGYRIYVIGQVKKPGQYVVGHYLDVIQALAVAGGLNEFASEDDIKIIRRENGKELIISFRYDEVKKGKKLHQNIILKSGDVVVVP